MNSLMKLLVLSTLLIFIMSNASALLQDLNTWDANNSRHANKGEDFNILVPVAWGDINSDFNYLIALNYNGIYVDLNVNVLSGTEAAASITSTILIDANVRSEYVSGNGPCAITRDVNILAWNPENDLNVFNVSVTIPSSGNIDRMVGHEVMVEIWPLIKTAGKARESTCGTTKVADGNFIVGPAILAYTPNPSNEVALIDQNITIFGFGFTPSVVNRDNNVQISIYDANSTRLSSAILKYQNDLNITKAYAFEGTSVPLLGVFHRLSTDLDTNGLVVTSADFNNLSGDWNGIKIWADANGEFDVNLTIPYVSATAGSTIGRNDLNTLRAYSALDGDVNAIFVIAPKLSLASDMNAVVTIDGIIYDLNTAILNRTISNIQEVANLIIKMGTIINGDSATRQISVAFDGDANFGINPILNMATDMNGRSGYVDIDLSKISNDAMGADINMYDVNIGSATIPFILKDGQPCSAADCTNQTWAYEAAAGDGNLAFTVSSFSIYEASPFDIEMIAPKGGQKIRRPRNGADLNYEISFKFKDLNIADNNSRNAPLRGVITYATKRGANTGVIIYDTNIFDTIGIRCNGYENISPSAILSDWQTCVFDLNKADLNMVGEFVIDVNIASHAGKAPFEQSALTGTDTNVFFNPPLIEITDVNINDGNFVINSGSGVADINYVLDFNIYLPDINLDQNFTLADYNIHFFLGPTQGSIGVGGGVNDINVLGASQDFDQNFDIAIGGFWDTNVATYFKGVQIRCIQPPAATPYFDYKCQLQYDTNGVFENKNYITARILNNSVKTTNYTTVNGAGVATVVTHVVDANELWDINASKYMLSINDGNAPRATFGPSGNYDAITSATRANSVVATITCDDNTSGVAEYYYKGPSGSWVNAGYDNKIIITNTTEKDWTVSYTAGCKDYAGNTSDINGTYTITLRPPGSRIVPDTGSPGNGGISPVVVIGTETILVVEIQGTASVENILETLTEAGFTEEEIATATIIAENTPVNQKVAVDKITNETGSAYQTWVSLKIRNTSNKKWKNVKVVVDIPKGIASNASQITSEFAMVVFKADPIIEFTIPEIQVGETAEIKYSTDKQISDVTARLLPLGMVTAYTGVAPCDGVNCATQVCATGGCNPTTGLCEYDHYADGTNCGDNKWCQSGACTEKPEPTPPPTPPPVAPPVDYTLPIVAAIIVIIVIGAAAYYYTKIKKGKGK